MPAPFRDLLALVRVFAQSRLRVSYARVPFRRYAFQILRFLVLAAASASAFILAALLAVDARDEIFTAVRLMR